MRFSHIYLKMPLFTSNTKVLDVIPIESKDKLSKEYLEYDTKTIDGKYYNLPDGKLVIILLLTDNFLWTTIRTAKYETYYRSLIGKKIPIIRS